ncbi:MAG: hypothetical protein GYB65_06480 [Chloroflexi bacterium]|nr:hypothetical protein [Chloroflexota bacterium]
MEDLYTRIIRQRGPTEKLFKRLPGFGGYMEMTARRQADRLMREHVAEQMKMALNRLVEVEKLLLDEGGLKYMSKTRSIKTKFQTLIDRIATDSPGYSGFFDAVKVDADDLAVVYAFDEAMLNYMEMFRSKIDALQQAALSGEGVTEVIRELDVMTLEANDAYSLRDNVLKGIT